MLIVRQIRLARSLVLLDGRRLVGRDLRVLGRHLRLGLVVVRVRALVAALGVAVVSGAVLQGQCFLRIELIVDAGMRLQLVRLRLVSGCV